MTELLDAYNEEGKLVKTEEKDKLLNEIKEHSLREGDAHLAVPAVFLLLVHPQNGIYVVKRADKSENPHLWCKTVGGHVHHGETPDEGLRRESDEEINTKVEIAHSIDDYLYKKQNYDLKVQAVVRQIDFKPWFATDRIDRETGRPWKRRFRAHIYAGVLEKEKLEFTESTGADEFSDGLGEAIEYMFYPKEELRELLEKGDRRFTHDLSILVRDYHPFL